MGAVFGTDAHINAHAAGIITKARKFRHSLASIKRPAFELMLMRQCVSIANLSYLMRVHGDVLDVALLRSFDLDLRRAVEAPLGGAMEDDAWRQATAGVARAGLGLREGEHST